MGNIQTKADVVNALMNLYDLNEVQARDAMASLEIYIQLEKEVPLHIEDDFRMDNVGDFEENGLDPYEIDH